jgi:LysM repeat protein
VAEAVAEAEAEAEGAEAVAPTLEVNEDVEPTSQVEASRTPSATTTTQATERGTPTAKATKKVTSTPKATKKVTSTPKATKTAKATKTERPKRTATPSVYTIRNGDVFSVIAKQFDLALDELMAANPNVNPERLTIGQKLIIPIPQEDEVAESDEVDEVNETTTATRTATPRTTRTATPRTTRTATPRATRTATIGPRRYTIRGGDTLSQIAERFDVTTDEILRANPTLNAERLKLDAEIIIPPPSPDNNSSSTSNSSQYTVREGDTFSVIAKRFDLTQQELQNANPNVNPDRLSIGQVIRIP